MSWFTLVNRFPIKKCCSEQKGGSRSTHSLCCKVNELDAPAKVFDFLKTLIQDVWSGVILLKDNANPEELSEPISAKFSLRAIKLRRVDFCFNARAGLDEFPEDNTFSTPPNGGHQLLLVGDRISRWQRLLFCFKTLVRTLAIIQ